jgi:hypothetical protein
LSKKNTVETNRRQETLLNWLFEFQELDVQSFQVRDWKNAQNTLKELVVVECVCAGKLYPDYWVTETIRGQYGFIEERHNESKFRRKLRPPTKSEVRKVHQWLRDVLETSRPSSVRQEDLRSPHIGYPSIPSRPRRYFKGDDFTVVQAVAPEDLYHESICELLKQFGSRIARCEAETCSKLFIRIRRQRYCSESCSQQVRSKVWYARHKEDKMRKSREAYQEQVEQKYPGSRVRVGRHRSKKRDSTS